MRLLERQTVFRDEIVAGDEARTPLSPGMEIYRNAYRGRLLAALETSFERTRHWVGEEAFAAAACHYVLTSPPTGWTLDDYGADFPEVLAVLFTQDPEVVELAWLEWYMSRAFAACDTPELDPVGLAAAGHSEAEWAGMRFTMAAGFAARTLSTNCTELWAALADGEATGWIVERNPDAALLVWRSGLSPRCRLTTVEELRTLGTLAEGATLADLAEKCDAARLGEWLLQWLGEGIFSQAIPGIAEGENHA